MFTVLDLLRSPGYAVPLVINLTGSVWFFLLIGKAGEWFFFWFAGVRGGGGWMEGVGEFEAEDGIRNAEGGNQDWKGWRLEGAFVLRMI